MFDLGFGQIAKWVAIAGIIGLLATGINKGINYHKDQITKAVNLAKVELALEQTQAVKIKEDELRELSRIDRDLIQEELKIERAKVSDLRRMLLIEHDLDRLLQRKPGLIVPLVNKGTEEYFKALEDATQ